MAEAEAAAAAAAEAPARQLTAAEKRAARRARVLRGSENRMKLLKGQISSLKEPSLDSQLDAGVDELMNAEVPPATAHEGENAAKETKETELKIPTRVDPAQRRRDAARRRRNKETLVQEMLGGESASGTSETGTSALAQEKTATVTSKAAPAFSRHSLALKLRGLEEKLVLLLIVGVAAYCAWAMDLQAITASLQAEDELFVTYQDLLARGVPLDSIRQRFEREQLQPEARDKLELLLAQQLKTEALGSSAADLAGSGWLPDVADLGFFLSSLLAHPPIALCVFLLRLVVATCAHGLHAALALPDVARPQEDDLGFLVNMALSSRPALKGFLVKARKSLDDVFLFLFVLVLVTAARALWLAGY